MDRKFSAGWKAAIPFTILRCVPPTGVPPKFCMLRVPKERIAVRLRGLFSLFATLLATGCAAPRANHFARPANMFPPDALVTQRAVLTARGRQFTLSGYASLSSSGGIRLILSENFGNALADVLMKRDGATHVLRSSRVLRESWIRRYVAADARCIFGHAPDADCPGRMVGPDHFVIERRWYTLDLRNVEIKPGLQPSALFDPALAGQKASP